MKFRKAELQTVMDCPLKYKFQYIDKIYKRDSASGYLDLYKYIENCFETVNKKIFNKVLTKPEDIEKDMTENFMNSWSKKPIEHEEIDFKQNGLTMIKNYVETGLPLDMGNFKCKTFLKLKLKKFEINLLVNRVDRMPNGNYSFVVLKTGKLQSGGQYMEFDLQTILTFLAASQTSSYSGKIENIKYLFLNEGKNIVIPFEKVDLKSSEIKIKENIINILTLKDYFEKSNNLKKMMPKVSEKYIFRSNEITEELCSDLYTLGSRSGGCIYCEYYDECPSWPKKPYELVNETKEEYKKRLTLSYSKFSSFKKCPRLWKFRYLDRKPSPPQPYFDFGHAIHETFEKFYSPYDFHERSLDYLNKIYDVVFYKFQKGYSSEEEREIYYDEGKEIIKDYYAQYLEGKPFRPAYYLEAYFELPVGKYVSLNGYIDRIDYIDNDEYEILDYKTEPYERTQEAVDEDKQLSIYKWASEKSYGLNIKRLSLLMVKLRKRMDTYRDNTQIDGLIKQIDEEGKDIKERSEAYKELIKEKREPIETELFPPTKNMFCKGCDVLDSCPLKEEIMADDSIKDYKYKKKSEEEDDE